MTSINTAAASLGTSMQTWGQHTQRTQSNGNTSLIEGLFAKLDTKNQGYIDKSELESAFASLDSADTSQTSAADQLFTKLDTDGNGKVTQDELSSGLQSLAQQLLTQLHQSGHSHRPPPPDGADQGMTLDQIEKQAGDGSANSRAGALLSDIAANFSAADTNQDGKISLREALAYEQSKQQTSDGVAGVNPTGSADSAAQADTLSGSTLQQFLKLLQLYASNSAQQNPVNDASSLSVSA